MDDKKIALVTISEKESMDEIRNKYLQSEGVIAATPNYIVELYEDSFVNDPGMSNQGYMNKISASEGWKYLNKFKHERIRVAVLDTGADILHFDLKNVINQDCSREILGYSGRTGRLKGDDYLLGSEVPADQVQGQGPGTHVSGIIAAESKNSIGVVGVGAGTDNTAIELMVVDVMAGVEKTSIAFVMRGLEYAIEQNAKVINLSLGEIKEIGMDDSIYNAMFEKFC